MRSCGLFIICAPRRRETGLHPVPEASTGEEPRDAAIAKGLEVIAHEQSALGAWKGDYGGPLFLVPVYLTGLHLLRESPSDATRDGFIAYIRGHQNADGGW